jgi:site-specific recombinase XerD
MLNQTLVPRETIPDEWCNLGAKILHHEKKLTPAADAALLKLTQVMTVGGYSDKSIAGYVREMRSIFEYYPDTLPSELSAEQIEKYICYIKQVFNSGHDKCCMLASNVSFFFKQVLKRPYDLPSKLYPRKAFKLPNVMTADEVRQLLSYTTSIKQKAIVELFYSSGIRSYCNRCPSGNSSLHLEVIRF